MDLRLDGKVVLVSGVSDGIGGAIAVLFAKAGASVACSGVQMDLVNDTVRAITRQAGRAIALPLDVTDEQAWEAAIDSTVRKFGGLDVLVNNAGVLLLEALVDTTLEAFRKVQAVNVEGTFLGLRQAVKAMRPGGIAGGGGSIVNISSVAAGSAAVDHVAYGASKAAVSAMTRHAACECAADGSGIRINAICPGVIRTGMFVETAENREFVRSTHPLGVGEVADVAAAALYLASDASRWVTGTELVVDGGYTVRP